MQFTHSLLDEMLASGKPFAVCSFPVNADNAVCESCFFPFEENGILKNEDGLHFIVKPSQPSFILSPQAETSKEQHREMIENSLTAIRSGQLEKVIISAIKHAPRKSSYTLGNLFERLCTAYPSAFVYLYHHPQHGTWLGASPELLLNKTGHQYQTIAMAGTQKVDDSTEIENLIWNDKLLHEQKVVRYFISQELTNAGVEQITTSLPYSSRAGMIAHLRTDFNFESKIPAEQIIDKLHPTPAISGFPKKEAVELYQKLEAHERRLYTGYLGVKYPNGDVRYFVNLRCMQVFEDHFELYVGGGITEGSVAEEEWEETEHKANTLRNVLN